MIDEEVLGRWARVSAEIRARRQWVGWEWTERGERRTKAPLVTDTGQRADVTRPGDWSDFDEAVVMVQQGRASGIGYVLTLDDPYTAIDLDDCRDAATGEVEAWARAIVDRFDSYTEVSPSGTGLRLFVRGALPPHDRRRVGNIEAYDDARFVTLTAHVVAGRDRIEDRQEELLAWHAETFPKLTAGVLARDPEQRSPEMDDAEVLALAFRARNGAETRRLHEEGHGTDADPSGEDLSLCNRLAFYTQDPEQLDRLFRSSALMREKWERADYRERTIDKALAGLQSVYQGGRPGDRSALTDTGNAARLAYRHGDKIRYVHTLKSWHIWDGRRWAPDETGGIVELAKDTVRAIYGEAGEAGGDATDRGKQLLAHARVSQQARSLKAMIALAESAPGIATTVAALDADPELLNFQNGTLDLRTFELRPHDPADLLTKVTAAPFEPGATSTVWARYLDEATRGQPGLLAFLQRLAGHTLVGRNTDEILVLLLGGGGSGKSTFLKAFGTALGDYARAADINSFLATGRGGGGGGARGDIARLDRARFVRATEPDRGKALDLGQIKTLTGGDTITARGLYQSDFEFDPSFTIWLAANASPRIDSDDEGIWRRLLRVPFENSRRKDQQDDRLKAELTDPARSGAAILAWAVEGCRAWRQGGLQIPEVVTAKTEELREDMDPTRDFFETRCVFDPEATVGTTELLRAYGEWARENRIQFPLGKARFEQTVTERGCRRDRTEKIRIWRGIGLVSQVFPVPFAASQGGFDWKTGQQREGDSA
jgi:putative DNA primase/helicase